MKCCGEATCRARRAASWMGAAMALAMAAHGDNPVVATQAAELMPAGAQSAGRHGEALDLRQDLLVVGAPLYQTSFRNDGAVFVWTRAAGGPWTVSATLVAPDPAQDDFFGRAVALDGDTLAVGSGSSGGSAYVLVRSGGAWTQQAKLVGAPGASYGAALDVSGDTLAVGAPEDPSGPAVELYVRSGATWTFQATVRHPTPFVPRHFGGAVAIDRGTLLVGTPDDQVDQVSAGSVYVFEWSGTSWGLEARLLAPVGAPFDGFGTSVALDGDLALVGAVREDAGGPDTGGAHVFARSAGIWAHVAALSGDDPVGGGEFGRSVALHGGQALVGARAWTGNAALAGAAFLFADDGAGWRQRARLQASDGLFGDFLGSAVATWDGTHALGAPAHPNTLPPEPRGAVYVYESDELPVPYCSAKPSSFGCLPWVGTSGRASATVPRFDVRGLDLIPGEVAVLLYGFAKANLAFHGGVLCVKAPVTRLLPAKPAGSTGPPPCAGTVSTNFNQRIRSGVDPRLTAGQQVFAQWRQRDPADPAGFGDSLTDGIGFVIAP